MTDEGYQVTKVSPGNLQVEGGANRFCVVTLTGPGVDVKENDNYYVRATFAHQVPRGPFGGISFNMEDADNGNYVMMR